MGKVKDIKLGASEYSCRFGAEPYLGHRKVLLDVFFVAGLSWLAASTRKDQPFVHPIQDGMFNHILISDVASRMLRVG
jgi:hypothetical protein